MCLFHLQPQIHWKWKSLRSIVGTFSTKCVCLTNTTSTTVQCVNRKNHEIRRGTKWRNIHNCFYLNTLASKLNLSKHKSVELINIYLFIVNIRLNDNNHFENLKHYTKSIVHAIFLYIYTIVEINLYDNNKMFHYNKIKKKIVVSLIFN